MTKKKEMNRPHEIRTENTWIQSYSCFVFESKIPSGVSCEIMPKQIVLEMAFAKSRTAHLSKGTLNFENELKMNWPTTDVRQENDVICPSIV